MESLGLEIQVFSENFVKLNQAQFNPGPFDGNAVTLSSSYKQHSSDQFLIQIAILILYLSIKLILS